MRFFHRFYNLNPITKTYVSKNYRTFHLFPHYRIVQALGSSQYDYHAPPLIPPDSPCCKIPKRCHVGHSHQHHHDERSSKDGENIFRLGLAADIGLAAGKAFTGYLSGSTAIIADAAHSVSDVVLSGVALLSFKAARVPKDKEHPYGHGKFETLGALGISFMLLGTAGGIAWHALDILLGLLSAAPDTASQVLGHEHIHNHQHGAHHHGLDMNHPVLALSMTIISISVKEGLYWITKRTGEREGSGLMKANAWHHRADAVSSLVALIGVGGSILGVKFLDPLAGIVVSGMILKAGLETGYASVLELVDAAVPSQQLDPYRQTILQVEGVKGCNHLRGRRAGSSLYLDVNIEVDPFSSVSAAHDVGENVRREIQKLHHEVAEVFIHIGNQNKIHKNYVVAAYFTGRNHLLHGQRSSDPAISQLLADTTDQPGKDCHNKIFSSEHKDIEDIVARIFSSKFSQEMILERITRHLIPGKILLQLEVSMPPDISIRDAIKVAEKAEREVLKAASSDNVQICIQLRLGDAIPQFHDEI